MKIKFLRLLVLASLLALPFPAFAAVRNLRDLIALVISYLNVFLILIIGLAVVTFVWNVYRYFILENEKRKEAGMYVLYSTIGFFVILSFWGLVAIITNTLNLPNYRPGFPFGGGGGYYTNSFTSPVYQSNITNPPNPNSPIYSTSPPTTNGSGRSTSPPTTNDSGRSTSPPTTR